MGENLTIMTIMPEHEWEALPPGAVVELKGVAVQRAFPHGMGNVKGPDFDGRPGELENELTRLVPLTLNRGDRQEADDGAHLQKLFGVKGLRARIKKGEKLGELVSGTVSYLDELYAALETAVANVEPAASLEITRLVWHIARASGTAKEIADAANLSFRQLLTKYGCVERIQRVWAAAKTNHADNGVCYDALRVAIETEDKALYVVAHVQIGLGKYVVMGLAVAAASNANLQTQMFGGGQALVPQIVIPAEAAEVFGLERKEHRATVNSSSHSNAAISLPDDIAAGDEFDCLVICGGEMGREWPVKDPQNRVEALAKEISQTTRRFVLANSAPRPCYVTGVVDLHVTFGKQNRNATEAAQSYGGLTLAQRMLAAAEHKLSARGEGQVASAEAVAHWKPGFVEFTRRLYPTNGEARAAAKAVEVAEAVAKKEARAAAKVADLAAKVAEVAEAVAKKEARAAAKVADLAAKVAEAVGCRDFTNLPINYI
jgi:hypothetical protein